MAASVNVGTGTSLAVGSTTIDSQQLIDIQWSGMSRESVETTHMGTSAGNNAGRTYMPVDLADPGEVTATFHFDPDIAPQLQAASDTLTITFPEANTWSATGFMTSYEVNDPLEDKMTCTATWKLSGDISVA